VADWIDMSKKTFGTQFITTTFRKELMGQADKFIGVRYGNQANFLSCLVVVAVVVVADHFSFNRPPHRVAIYIHLAYFWPFGIFLAIWHIFGHLVYFWPFGIFYGH
jgi:hypothetical protein